MKLIECIRVESQIDDKLGIEAFLYVNCTVGKYKSCVVYRGGILVKSEYY